MKKALAIILALLMIAALAACGNADAGKTQLGTSGFSIVIPEGFAESEDDYAEDQVAYYYKDDKSIDFDVYQWAKDDKYVLEEEAAYYAAEYGTTAEKVTVNSIPGMKYISVETFDGFEYTVINYMFDDGKNIVELSFWTVNTAEELAVVDEIINTISQD